MSDLPAETIPPAQHKDESTPLTTIEQILREHFGLSGNAEPIANEPHAYVIDNGHMRYRLDVSAAESEADLSLEAKVLRHLARKADAPDAPEPVAAQNGQDVVALDGSGKAIRLTTIQDGTELSEAHRLDAEDIAGIGRLAGATAKSLSDFEEPGLERSVDADLRHAGPVVLRLLSGVDDHAIRDPIAKVLVTALRQVQPLGPMLRIQPVHHDLTLSRMRGRMTEDGNWRAEGITDVGGVVSGWLVASLAVTCADLIARGGDDPFDILPAVRAFHDIHALTEPELQALWPLIIARACVLAAQAEHDAIAAAATDGDNGEIHISDGHIGKKVFALATGVHPALMEAAILDVIEFDTGNLAILSEDICRLLPEIDVEQIRLVDLGIDSPLLIDGNWTDPEIDWRLLARISWETHMGATRYGEYRFSRSIDGQGGDIDNFALHVDICVPAGSVVVAPFGGMLKEVGQQLVLVGREATLYLEGLVCPLTEGMALFAEDAIGSVAGAEGSVGGLRIRLCRNPEIVPPLFSTPARAAAWRRLCPSPSQLLGIDIDAPPAKRGEPVRGWRDNVYDGTGKASVDLSGAAGIVGHGHPALASAAYRQWSLLSGQIVSSAEQRFREQLLKTLPQGLDVIAAIGSEREMMELAHTLLRSDDRQPGFFDLEDGIAENSTPALRIADERLTGFGRTGRHFWQFEQDEVLPDIVVTGSILPGKSLAALVTRGDMGTEDECRTDLIDAVDYAVATAALAALRDEGLQENARLVGNYLRSALEPLTGRYGVELRGEGLAIAMAFPDSDAGILARALGKHGFAMPQTDDPQLLSLRPPLCLDRSSAEKFAEMLSILLSEREKAGGKDNENSAADVGEENDKDSPLSAEMTVTI
ncbi:aminotransferase class III-fold pyridoxal phosphate-dependent enzyme [Rhizobiales bacterium RZME27]|uniref:Aminotransferase class III-fold pyridoxal phosphate-dependent enzyme n=1 Tax=Endobacterium cereale TaxID=2663029 RepID=A0A6A8A4E2_9HYPH|nr:aminotransferase class III-fold pyridoxal phosphate-dependent enzyme [Endobacterium cereale]MEB2845121.1 aminotransferase class III-fold pyridoxal phosphate-dependent enzyme [Endobacterium cereale]MQY45893.1 aminotransferase class III-fold pyridoxal phosphate-dependent enzyme [Endobacterium cereale]